MQQPAAEQLQAKLRDALGEARLTHGAIETFVSLRHLGVIVRDLPETQPDRRMERKGPKTSAPQAAIDGFCRSLGVSVDNLDIRTVGKEDWYFAVKEEKGQPAAEALRAILEELLRGFHWPKSMRWGAHDIHWVRPLQSLLCLFGSQVVPVRFGHLCAGNVTYGHRFLAPEPIEIGHADEYVAKLEQACVQVEREVRKERIATELDEVAAEQGLRCVADEALLEEVTGLVEWPVVLPGTFEAHYLKLPPEVLLSEMREHQKYFGVMEAGIRDQGPTSAPRSPSPEPLSNHFLVVANLPTQDGGAAIAHGNARVLRARLADGEFYWNSDRAVLLSDWADRLKGVIFHAKIGSLKDKAERMERLAPLLAVFVPHANLTQCARAAKLAKADLVTGMVGEFPDLQGIMGRYYALEQGEEPDVAHAIAEHYSPLGASDDVPASPVSVVVGLSDKLDSLVALFAIGEKPTGSKDPFALRRAALGVIRIILENRLRMPLKLAFDKAASLFARKLFADSKEATVAELLSFFEDRLKAMLKGQGIRHDVIAAVMTDGEDDLVRVVDKARALQGFLEGEDGANLLAAYKRAGNILSAEEEKDGNRYDGAPEPVLFEVPAEQTLYQALEAMDGPVEEALEQERFEDAMQALASLRGPQDDYFDAVMVNAENPDLRANRLRTLNRLREAVRAVADFSQVEG